MENNYLISVIVPVHNTVNYLRKCIESIRNQSLENIEIILVDNLSTDGSSEVCDECKYGYSGKSNPSFGS